MCFNNTKHYHETIILKQNGQSVKLYAIYIFFQSKSNFMKDYISNVTGKSMKKKSF